MATRFLLSEVEFCCPVCHDTFRDPVILSCGHSFCAACLQRWWRGNPAQQECPVCKRRSSRGDPPRNLALRHLCEAFLQERASAAAVAGEEGVCSLHAEKLRLFCLDHQQLVCLVCRDSEQHAGHRFRPVDEAARPRKEQAWLSLEALQRRLKLLKTARGDRLQEAERIKVRARDAERQIVEEFKERYRALREEEQARVSAVREEERSNSREVRLEIEGLSSQIAALSDSVGAAERELRAASVSILQTHTTATLARALPQQHAQLTEPETHKPTLVEKVLNNLTSARACSLISGLRKYACELTLDPNTVNRLISLSEDNRRVTWVREQQTYPDHPDRFTSFPQVLCREGLTGRSYWEVDWEGLVVVGVAYWGIGRSGEGNDCCLGWNDQSWVLECSAKGYAAWHNNMETTVALAPSPGAPNRLGVYVDWAAGSLSFYVVASSDAPLHVHTFYCSFTQELHAGFELGWYGSSATLRRLEGVE